MKRTQIAEITLILVLMLVAACAPAAAPAPAPVAPAPAAPAPAGPAPTGPAKAAWQVEWENTVAAAKKEGRVTLVTPAAGTLLADMRRPLSDRFGIALESVTGTASEVSQKVLAERRAGLSFYDISLLAPTTVLPVLKPKGIIEKLDSMLVLPEVTDTKYWREGTLPWSDRDHTVFVAGVYVTGHININTDLVKPQDYPKSFVDLLDPKWKGKIVTHDPLIMGSAGNTFWAMMGEKFVSWDFVREMRARQEMSILRDSRLEVEWLTRGKVPIGLGLSTPTLAEFIALGAPIKLLVAREGAWTASAGTNIAVFVNAPHPNAAKVFANWFLSQEGQKVAVDSLHLPSARLDVSIEGFDPARIPQPGVKYIDLNTEDFINESGAWRQKAADIFK